MSSDIRVLFLADSHLGFDLPTRERVKRRRRGHDFLANHVAALEPARRGEVDLVVHGGDVFDMPVVAPSVAYQAYHPLVRVAAAGVPVFVVPGNHERSSLPHRHLLAHPNVHVFDRPRTFVAEVRGTRVALAGLPYERRGVRALFPQVLAETGWNRATADLSLLCLHQCVEGATVGPADFTFRNGDDVVRGRDIPAGFAAVLSGHIHRHQVLTTDPAGRALAAPVLYPGSIERTALAEIGEPKGFLVLRLRAPGQPASPGPAEAAAPPPIAAVPALATPEAPASPAGTGAGGRDVDWEFRPLPARPMLLRELAPNGGGPAELDRALRALVAAAPADAVLTIRLGRPADAAEARVLSAAHLRTYVPETMNVAIRSDWRD